MLQNFISYVFFFRNELKDYLELLIRNYNIGTIDKLMCRDLLSVGWDGKIYDCDFNQQLDINLAEVNNSGKMESFFIFLPRKFIIAIENENFRSHFNAVLVIC